eukprot:3362828-Rhodomonas_salina.3
MLRSVDTVLLSVGTVLRPVGAVLLSVGTVLRPVGVVTCAPQPLSSSPLPPPPSSAPTSPVYPPLNSRAPPAPHACRASPAPNAKQHRDPTASSLTCACNPYAMSAPACRVGGSHRAVRWLCDAQE